MLVHELLIVGHVLEPFRSIPDYTFFTVFTKVVYDLLAGAILTLVVHRPGR